MVRLIYKTILISIISSMLMIGELTAFADTVGTPVRGADGIYSRTNTYDVKGVEDQDSINIITMFAVGVVATQLLMYKKWTTDMMAAAAAGGVYIVGEVMNVIGTKNELKNQTLELTKRTDGTVDSKQVEYIKKLKESYKAVLSSLKRKKMLLYAATAGFGIATGIAVYQIFTEKGSFAGCQSAIATADTALATCTASAEIAPMEAAGCAACVTKVTTLQSLLTSLETNSSVPGPSAAKAALEMPIESTAEVNKNTPCSGATAISAWTPVAASCGTYLEAEIANRASGTPTPGMGNVFNLLNKNKYSENKIEKSISPSMTRKILQKITNSFFPQAQASMMSLMGLGAGALASFAAIKLGLGTYIDTMMAKPIVRTVVWGLFTSLTMYAINSTSKKIDEVEKNMKKIDELLGMANSLSKGIEVNPDMKITPLQLNPANFMANDVTLSGNDKTSCIPVSGAAASATKTSGGCTALSAIDNSVSGLNNLPAGVSALTSQLTKVADGISGTGTISGTTMGDAAALGGKANAISNYVKGQQKSLNDLLKKQGKKTIDFESDQNKFKNSLLGKAASIIKGQGMTPSGFLSSFGMSGGSSSGPSNDKKLDSGNLDASKKALGKAAIGGGAGGSATGDFKMVGEGASKEEGVLANGMKEGTADDHYEIKGSDINEDSKVSIFELISSRYIKSGYPKLLEEETTPEKK